MLRRTIARAWWRRYARRNARPWDDLERFPGLPQENQRRELALRLLDQLHYFGNRPDALPEWREAARVQDPEELWRVWPELPVLTKEDLRNRFPPEEVGQRFGIAGRVNATGGSTGEPTRFFHDTGMLTAIEGAEIYSRLRMGWRPGMATIVVWGAERDIGRHLPFRARVHHWLVRDFLVAGYSLSPKTALRVRSAVERHRPAAIYGFSSMLEYVAREILRVGALRPGSVRVAWCGGEMLYAAQRQVFKRAFGVDILNRYGGRELGVMACQFVPGGPLEVMRPWVMIELLNSEGRAVAPGEAGRVVVTSTICRGSPFLRYDVGDYASADPLASGHSGIAALAELHGRTADILRLPDGRTINNIFWNHLFKEFPEVRQFQVLLQKDGGLRILLVGSGFAAQREQQCRATLERFLGAVKFQLHWTEWIPPAPNGKLRQVVVE
jgi:phenylacetate-CoA ligase